jgi:hypothetical protein
MRSYQQGAAETRLEKEGSKPDCCHKALTFKTCKCFIYSKTKLRRKKANPEIETNVSDYISDW